MNQVIHLPLHTEQHAVENPEAIVEIEGATGNRREIKVLLKREDKNQTSVPEDLRKQAFRAIPVLERLGLKRAGGLHVEVRLKSWIFA